MKFVGIVSIFLFCHLARAADLLSCQTSDGDHLQSQFRVYESGNGLQLDSTSCKGLAHAICQPYTKQIPIVQDLVDVLGHEYRAMTFHGGDVRIIHIFGAYQYSDASSGLTLQFPDSGCQKVASDPQPVKPILCLTVGQSNSGKLLGIRVYEQPDGTRFAAMENVSVFHRIVYDFDESTRIEIPLREQHLCTGQFYYFGDGFRLFVNDSGPIVSGGSLGTLEATFAGAHVSGQVFVADDTASGFCE